MIIQKQCPFCKGDILINSEKDTEFCSNCGKQYSVKDVMSDSWHEVSCLSKSSEPQKTEKSGGKVPAEKNKKREKKDKHQAKDPEEAKKWKIILISFIVCFSLLLIMDFKDSIKTKNADGVPISISSEDVKGKDYEDVLEILAQDGFTNITTSPIEDLIIGWLTKDGEIESIKVAGTTSFSSGAKFDKDAHIVISYHTFPNKESKTADSAEEKDIDTEEIQAAIAEEQSDSSAGVPTPTPKASDGFYVSHHSSGDSKTANKGVSGVYAYKNKGGQYNVYYIIDLDEGCVYYFADGNGSGTCDKVAIDNGDMNNGIQFTYHDGRDKWSEAISFKWKNQSENMIWWDSDGNDFKFYATSLEDALKIRDQKQIVKY